jgi:uncharacterized membrane protein
LSDPSTYWLTITNISLGVVTVLCCLAVAFGVVQELAARRKKKAAEAAGLAPSFSDGHSFGLPQLGLTMADGGEPVAKKEPGKETGR